MLQAREGSVHNIVKEAHGELIKFSKNKKQYAKLLTDLTVQVSTASICLLNPVIRYFL